MVKRNGDGLNSKEKTANDGTGVWKEIQNSRRNLLKTMGTVAGFGTLSDVATATGSDTSSSIRHMTGVTRTKLRDQERSNAITKAKNDTRYTNLVNGLPDAVGQPNPETAQAYQITFEDPSASPITQVRIPIDRLEHDLGYAFGSDGVSVGARISENRWIHIQNTDARTTNGVEHKSLLRGEHRGAILSSLHGTKEYQQTLQGLEPEYDVRHDDASIVLLEEAEKAVAYVTATPKKKESKQRGGRTIVATVNANSKDVVTIQSSYTDCVVNCLPLSSSLWSSCLAGCCAFCADGISCVCCVGCMGAVGAYCAAKCA